MVETGARERTSHTHKNQRAAEQRETEELRDVGDELKMAACLLLLLFSSLNTAASGSGEDGKAAKSFPVGASRPSERPGNAVTDQSHLEIPES